MDDDIAGETGIVRSHQNYPNPFSSETVISYQLSTECDLELCIYNMLGQKVATLISEKQQAGKHYAIWDASMYPNGIYFYRIYSVHSQKSGKMILNK